MEPPQPPSEPKPPRLSLRALAALAGVSVSTASRALNDHPVISAPVRRRLKALARRRGYVVNPLVGQIYSEARTGHGFRHLGTLAYVTSYDTPSWWHGHPTLEGFHAGVVERARRMGMEVDEFWALEPGLRGRRLTQILRARGIGGVVLAPVPSRNAEGLLDWREFSVVQLGESVKTPRLNRVATNLRQALQLALRELTRLGYRRIGLALRRRYHTSTDFNLLATFLLFQRELRPAERVAVQSPENWTEKNLLAWFERHRPDAIIGAVGPMREWLRHAGQACPRDVGLVSLDLTEDTGGFAGIDQNARAVGAAAVDLLMSELRHHERGVPAIPRTVLVDTMWRAGRTLRQVARGWVPAFLDENPAEVGERQ